MASVDIAVETRKRDVDQRLPLKYYYRTADNVLKQAEVYRREDNHIQLYVLLVRFCGLIVETIPRHREYKDSSYIIEKQEFNKRARDAVAEMEKLKPVVQALNTTKAPAPPQLNGGWPSSMGLNGPATQFSLPPSNQGYRPSTWQLDLLTGSLDQLSLAAPTYSPTTSLSTPSFEIPRPRDETLSRHSFFAPPPQERLRGPAKVAYPTSFIDDSPIDLPPLDPSWATPTPPAPPPQPHADAMEVKLIRQPSPPPIEAQVQVLPSPPHPQLDPSSVADPRPGPAAANSGGMEDLSDNSKGPKSLHISSGMMEEFMRLVKSNTQRNLETCGVLAGTLCQTVNEEEIFEAQDKRGLFQLGWIHTHPSQACFMSSIDLHTHYSYQVMLPEAVAIVMAPSDNNRKFGIFRLADPGGVKVIQSCQQRGFHTHESPPGGGPIYEHCAHVFINPNLKFDVIDLR